MLGPLQTWRERNLSRGLLQSPGIYVCLYLASALDATCVSGDAVARISSVEPRVHERGGRVRFASGDVGDRCLNSLGRASTRYDRDDVSRMTGSTDISGSAGMIEEICLTLLRVVALYCKAFVCDSTHWEN